MTSNHLLLIGIDGLRIDRAFGSGLAPTLDRIASEGAFHRARMEVPTISGPGWATILTGLTHAEHGVTDNTFAGHTVPEGADILSRVAASDPNATTFAVTAWGALTDPAGPGPLIAHRPEDIRREKHRVVSLDGELYSYRIVDEEVSRRVSVGIELAGPTATFAYLGQPDDAGHYWGVHCSEYDVAVRETDRRVARMLSAAERRAEAQSERWVVAITTDHGHVDEGGHGGGSKEERQTFLLVTVLGGPSVVIPDGLEPHHFAGFLLDTIS